MAMRDEPKVYLKRLSDRSLDPVKDVGASRQQDGGQAMTTKSRLMPGKHRCILLVDLGSLQDQTGDAPGTRKGLC